MDGREARGVTTLAGTAVSEEEGMLLAASALVTAAVAAASINAIATAEAEGMAVFAAVVERVGVEAGVGKGGVSTSQMLRALTRLIFSERALSSLSPSSYRMLNLAPSSPTVTMEMAPG